MSNEEMAHFAQPAPVKDDKVPAAPGSSSSDDAIRATNDDASSCKRYAVQKGYWIDPYLKYLVRSASRKAPEISRGYYCRTQAMQILLHAFIRHTNHACQVVNFGAGFDTTYWLLKDKGLVPTRVIDVDFGAVTARKCHYIKTRKELLEKLTTTEDGEISFSPSDLHSDNYHIVAADLRRLQEVETKLHESEIDYSLPTFFMAECVLVYVDTGSSSKLLKWITDKFDTAFFVNYEQVNMSDRFGQVMLDNLQSRNCCLHGVGVCESVDSQNARYTTTGWDGAESLLMTQVYSMLPQTDVQRIEKLEFLDDRDILNQLFHHYCVSRAWKDSKNIGLEELTLNSYQNGEDT